MLFAFHQLFCPLLASAGILHFPECLHNAKHITCSCFSVYVKGFYRWICPLMCARQSFIWKIKLVQTSSTHPAEGPSSTDIQSLLGAVELTSVEGGSAKLKNKKTHPYRDLLSVSSLLQGNKIPVHTHTHTHTKKTFNCSI